VMSRLHRGRSKLRKRLAAYAPVPRPADPVDVPSPGLAAAAAPAAPAAA
jgi:hypothetical protein